MSILTHYSARQAGITDTGLPTGRNSAGPSAALYMPFDEGTGAALNYGSSDVSMTNEVGAPSWAANGLTFQFSGAPTSGTWTSIGTNAFMFGLATNLDAIAGTSTFIIGAASIGASADHIGFDINSSLLRMTVKNTTAGVTASGTTTYSAGDVVNGLIVVDQSVAGSRNYYFYTSDDGLVGSGTTNVAAIQDMTIANTALFGFNAGLPNIVRQIVYNVFDGGLPSDWSTYKDELLANMAANTKRLPSRFIAV